MTHTQYDELKKTLCKELEQFVANPNNMKMSDLDVVHKLLDCISKIDKIEMYEYSDFGGYSNRTQPMMPYYGGYNSYNGYSYAERGGNQSNRGRYSRDDEKEHIARELERLINDTDDSVLRDSLNRALSAVAK